MANLQSLFQEFNLSKFIVYTCLLMFSILFAMRLDGTITVSYWAVFLPLWIWKSLVVTGAAIGVCVWARNPDYRLSESSYISFKSMLISLSLQLLLLMFELLVCDKLESGRHLWTLAFIPLLFVSLLSVAITVWSLKNDRSFDLELFCAVNVLQFLFIALRLDNLLTWSWVVVFVPFWVLITLAVIGVLYALIFAAILLRTPEIAVDQRRASFNSAISYSLVVLPLVVFLVLLANKLDASAKLDHNQHTQSLTLASHHFSFPHFVPTTSAPSHRTVSTGQQAAGAGRVPASSSQSNPIDPMTFLPRAPVQHATAQSAAAQLSYFTVCCPLYLAFMILICLSFGSRGGNLCEFKSGRLLLLFAKLICSRHVTGWFGMRRDFCSFLLTICPCLQEYGNISYYSKHTSSPGHHELDRGPLAVVSRNGNDNNSSSSSSSNGLTGPSSGSVLEEEDSATRRANLEKSFHSMTSRMSTMVVCQPTKKHPHLHVTIESPD